MVGHSGAGKTSLTEALLFNAGLTNRLGRVEDGTTVTDSCPDEVKRQMTIDSSAVFFDWNEHRIYMVDTPGYADFSCDVKYSMWAFDGAILIVDATSGIEVGAETVWEYADEFKMPRLIFVNMMDKESANFSAILGELNKKWGKSAKIIPLQIPIGKESEFKGVVDLLSMKAFVYSDGKEADAGEIPSELSEQVKEARAKLVEVAAENDDALIEKYLEGEELSVDEMKKGLRAGVIQNKVVPVECGCAYQNIAVKPLYDAIVDYLPSPSERSPVPVTVPGTGKDEALEFSSEAPLVSYVFKTINEPHLGNVLFFRVYSGKLSAGSEVYNPVREIAEKVNQIYLVRGKNREEVSEVSAGHVGVVAKFKGTRTGDTLCDKGKPLMLKTLDFPEGVVSIALKPKTKKDQEKLSTCLSKLAEEDPALRVRHDHEFGQTVVTGIGDVHLDVVVERLRDRFGVDCVSEKTKVAYRETIRSSVKVQGKYKKQSGGRGQYGDVWLAIEPLPSDQEFEFVNKIVGGAIPGRYVPAVEKGVRGAMSKGTLAGYPVVNVKATVYDGSFHEVDSSDMAFQIAGSMAFKKAFSEANPALLEPYVEILVVIPDAYVGDVTSDLNSKRGRIMGIEPGGGRQVIKAHVPLAEIGRYSTDLKSMTHGRGSYQMKFSHYEEMPSRMSEKLISEAKKQD
jgi:elongation factor G